MNVTPQEDVTIDDLVFYNKIIYVAEEGSVREIGDYGLQEYFSFILDEVTYKLPEEYFVPLPDKLTLDTRTQSQRMYDDLKQRDTDYHKVYFERMGIKVMTYAEEEKRRHSKKNQQANVGLPEGTTGESRP